MISGSRAGIGKDNGECHLGRDVAVHSLRPYLIVRDESVGRYMVAARDIKAGEIVMEEIPLTFGPTVFTGTKLGCRPVCLGCYNTVTGSYLCPGCNWPMCGEVCSNEKVHVKNECRVFRDRNFKVDADRFNYGEVESMYSCISPIRGLILRDSNPKHWNIVWNLMSHREQRKESSFWKDKHARVADIIRSKIGLSQYTLEDIDTLLGIFLVNDFGIDMRQSEEFDSVGGSPLRGVYSLCAIPNHKCISNVQFSNQDQSQQYKMTVCATINIRKGEEINPTYVEPLQPTLMRQQILSLGKFFHCQCPRCSDPTELGLFASALLCQCKGSITMTDTTEITSTWKCQSCAATFTADQVSKINTQAKQEADLLEYDSSNLNQCGIPAHEKFLKKFSKFLHPNHVILIQMKYCLCKMYGRMPGYEAPNLSNQQYLRKQQLCLEVLAVLDKLLPGKTRMRGLVMYELHLPLVMLANRNLELGPAGGIQPNKIKADLRAGLNYLRMALNILQSQPQGSFEAKIVTGSKNSVQELEGWLQTVSQSI